MIHHTQQPHNTLYTAPAVHPNAAHCPLNPVRIAKLPINPKVASAVDAGCVELADTDELEPLAEFFTTL